MHVFNFSDVEKIVLKLDRYDPGRISASGDIVPIAMLPNDVVVPVSFTNRASMSEIVNLPVFNPTKEQYIKAFKACIIL